MNRAIPLAGLLACAALSQADIYTFKANLSGSQEVPVVTSTGTGAATLVVDTSGDLWTFKLNMAAADLQGQPVMAHIHQAPVGVAGPIAVDLGSPTTFGGTADHYAATWNESWGMGSGFELNGLTREQLLSNLQGGLLYANVHTGFAPDGEIRGQFAPVPEPASMAALGFGLVGLLGRKRRRKAEAAV